MNMIIIVLYSPLLLYKPEKFYQSQNRLDWEGFGWLCMLRPMWPLSL
jgi:hypothetical protein